MLISIIIPTYKRPHLLSKAIDSCLAQTYKDVEIIVVSDNDIDSNEEMETLQVIESYKGKIHYLPTIGNHGGSYTRNRGLREAKGEYVNFLDDDDCLYPTKIEKQVAILEKTRETLACVGCLAAIKDADGTILRIEKPEYNPHDIFFSELNCNICTTSVALVRKEACVKSGGWQTIESSQEHLFFINLFKIMPTFAYVHEILLDINWHAGTRVSTNKHKPLGTLKLTEIIRQFYKNMPKEKVRQIQLSRLKQDIYAYLLLDDIQKAMVLYRRRLKLSILNKDNIKILVKIILHLVKAQ